MMESLLANLFANHLDTLYCLMNPLFAILSPLFGQVILYD